MTYDFRVPSTSKKKLTEFSRESTCELLSDDGLVTKEEELDLIRFSL